MPGNVQSDTSGRPTYEQNVQAPQETAPASIEQRIEDKTVKSYDAEDIQKYGVSSPTREKIDAKIVRREWQKTCITSKETKTTG